MSEQLVLAIDAGTSSAKVGLVARDGLLLRLASRPYPMSSPHPGWAEQSADDWWTAVQAATREVLAGINPADVAAVGLSNAGGSMVALDAQGQPVRPAIVWMDSRAARQAERLVADQGPAFWRSRLGYSSIGFAIGAKMVWLREHEPAIYRNISHVLQPADYVVFRMTGAAATDRSNACATGLYNLYLGEWDDGILSLLEIDERMLPSLADSGTVAGQLLPDAASALGLTASIPIVLGAWDQVCAVLGAGSISGQDALLSAGTAWTLAQPVARLGVDAPAGVWTVQHARRGESVLMIAMSNGGAIVEWYRRVFAGVCDDQPSDTGGGEELSGLPAGVEDVPPGSAGVLVLPHLIGAMGIHMEPEYSACILGLRHGTGRAQIFRAMLEAVAYELRWSLEVLADMGIPTTALRMVGGATRSPIWPQIVADVSGLDVLMPHETECAVLGAARLAQEGVGLDVLPQSDATRIERAYQPDAEAVAIYSKHYEVYQSTHRALKGPLTQLDRVRNS